MKKGITIGVYIVLLCGCVASGRSEKPIKVERGERPKSLGGRWSEKVVDEYHFISWEPYHFFLTLGILPQYNSVTSINGNDSLRVDSICTGWVSLIMPIMPNWHYGSSEYRESIYHLQKRSAQQVDSAEASTIAVPPSDPSGSPR